MSTVHVHSPAVAVNEPPEFIVMVPTWPGLEVEFRAGGIFQREASDEPRGLPLKVKAAESGHEKVTVCSAPADSSHLQDI